MPIEVVNTRNILKTSFAAGLRISSDMDLLFLSGVTARPLDLTSEDPFEFPDDLDQQARMALDNIQEVLDEAGITWREVIKIVRFYTETPTNGVRAEYLGDWNPCSTTLGVDQLPDAGAKIMYDVTAAVPRA